MTPQSQNFRLANQKNVLLMVSFMIDMFTPKKMSLKKQPETHKDFDFDSAVRCTPWSLTPQWETHRWAWLRGGMHIAELSEKFWLLDSAVWCTLRSLTPRWDAHRRVRLVQICPFLWFRICNVFRLRFFEKCWSKKDSLTLSARSGTTVLSFSVFLLNFACTQC